MRQLTPGGGGPHFQPQRSQLTPNQNTGKNRGSGGGKRKGGVRCSSKPLRKCSCLTFPGRNPGGLYPGGLPKALQRTSKGLLEDLQKTSTYPKRLIEKTFTFSNSLIEDLQNTYRRLIEDYRRPSSILGDLRPECHIPAKLWPTLGKTRFSLAHGPEKPTPVLL
jgi:hypothetical protein